MKLPKWLRDLFCKHNYVEQMDDDTKEWVRICEKQQREGKLVSYSYSSKHICSKCGKTTFLGSGMIC